MVYNAKGGRIEAILCKPHATNLHKIALKFGLTLDPNLHCTLMCDKSNPYLDLPFSRARTIKASVTGYRVMGKKIALTLDSLGLNQCYNDLCKAGFTHAYRGYVPHLSLFNAFDIEPEVMDAFMSYVPISLIFQGIQRFSADN